MKMRLSEKNIATKNTLKKLNMIKDMKKEYSDFNDYVDDINIVLEDNLNKKISLKISGKIVRIVDKEFSLDFLM
jgi:hypothetical protein